MTDERPADYEAPVLRVVDGNGQPPKPARKLIADKITVTVQQPGALIAVTFDTNPEDFTTDLANAARAVEHIRRISTTE